MEEKKAVILLSMGGPDSLKSVRPFLFNLFNDRAILRINQPFRWFLAHLISWYRAPRAKEIYQQMGGASPLLKNTRAQAEALEKKLAEEGPYKCFVGMRYWHPFIEETIKQVKAYEPQEIILLPMYPQFSTTTSQSVLDEAKRNIQKRQVQAEIKIIRSFQTKDGFIKALVSSLRPLIKKAEEYGSPKILLSAHGLPERIVQAGDPYPDQCKETSIAISQKLGLPEQDWVLCYQSRLGPMEWIGPETKEEITKASLEKRPILVVPISFVCEHAETIVELDQAYRKQAEKKGCPFFAVIPTVQTHPAFIEEMANAIRRR